MDNEKYPAAIFDLSIFLPCCHSVRNLFNSTDKGKFMNGFGGITFAKVRSARFFITRSLRDDKRGRVLCPVVHSRRNYALWEYRIFAFIVYLAVHSGRNLLLIVK